MSSNDIDPADAVEAEDSGELCSGEWNSSSPDSSEIGSNVDGGRLRASLSMLGVEYLLSHVVYDSPVVLVAPPLARLTRVSTLRLELSVVPVLILRICELLPEV